MASNIIVWIQKKIKPIILAKYSQLERSKFEVKNEANNATEENPTVNKHQPDDDP
ncbi:MAG: hypothetical protein ACJZ1S_01450 [Candidatus Neomarinimicrobiota bacterium]